VSDEATLALAIAILMASFIFIVDWWEP